MVQQISTKVIIIGAGPAGAATSIFLGKAGIEHLVIEKDIFPRDKVCGDACSGKTAYVIRAADPKWLDEVHERAIDFMPCHGIQFVAPNGKGIDIPYKPHRQPEDRAPGFTVPRLKLDAFLFEKLDHAYAKVFQQAAISSVSQAGTMNKVCFTQHGISYEVTAPVIVGADGDKSIVRKTMLKDFAVPKTSAVGLRAYYENVGGMHKENFIELHFLPEVLPGYLWIFPLPNGQANVGIGILSDIVRKKKLNLREMMLNALKNNPNISHRFKDAKLNDKILGWGLPMCMEREPVSGAGFVLIGDAAALIDPFSGEGIGNALFSGKLAAEAIQRALEKDDHSADFYKKEYDDVLFRKIGSELKISAAMQKLCRYPWLFNFVVNKAHKSPSLQQTISCMFADLDLRAQLKKPSFYFKILFNR